MTRLTKEVAAIRGKYYEGGKAPEVDVDTLLDHIDALEAELQDAQKPSRCGA